jgi:hypothetical protein
MNPHPPDPADPLAAWLEQRRAAFTAADLRPAVMRAVRPPAARREDLTAELHLPAGAGLLLGLLRTALLLLYLLNPA